MEEFISTLVVLIQILLGGFVAWGGWLVLSPMLRRPRAEGAGSDSKTTARADDFERVASLVLLALLCMPLMAGA